MQNSDLDGYPVGRDDSSSSSFRSSEFSNTLGADQTFGSVSTS